MGKTLPRTLRAKTKSEAKWQSINVPEQAIKITDKDLDTLLQWWAICERYPIKAKLVERMLKANDIETLKMLKSTFGRHNKYQRDYLMKITDFLRWCQENKSGEDPWNDDMFYRFLLYANQQLKAGTYAGRFISAINWFLPQAENTTTQQN